MIIPNQSNVTYNAAILGEGPTPDSSTTIGFKVTVD